MKARFSSTVPTASSVAARRMYGDFGAPLPLVVVVVVLSDIDSLTKHPSVMKPPSSLACDVPVSGSVQTACYAVSYAEWAAMVWGLSPVKDYMRVLAFGGVWAAP